MGSVLAIVSKAVFEKERAPGGRPLGEGDVWATDAYVSGNKGLSPLAGGGTLYLVTVRPGDVLWLVGRLRNPTFDGARWVAAPNTDAIVDIGAAIPKLVFANGKGLTAKPGALGMSLQTPRLLADEDETLLDGLLGGEAAPAPAPAGALPVPAPAPAVPAPVIPAPTAAPTPAPAPLVPPAVEGPAPTTDVGRWLATAASTLADDPATALDAILRCWRLHPYEQLVALADALSQRAESPVATALRNGGPDDATWPAVAAAGLEADVGALAATFELAKLDTIHDRVVALTDRPPDPRVAAVLHRLLLAPPFRSTSSQPIWTRLFEHVLAHPDPATLAVVRRVAAGSFPAGKAMSSYMAAKLANVEDRLVKGGAASLAPDAEAATWLDALRGALVAPPPTPATAAATVLATAPEALPTPGAGAVRPFGGLTAREFAVSASGRTLAALVADPSEHTQWESWNRPQTTIGVAVVDVATGEPRSLWPTTFEARLFALGAGDGLLAVGGGRSVTVIDLRDRTRRTFQVLDAFPEVEDASAGEPEKPQVRGLAFDPHDQLLFVSAVVGRPDQRDGRDFVRRVPLVLEVDLRSGALRVLFEVPPTADWVAERAELPLSVDEQRVALSTGRAVWVWDRRWGAFSQGFSLETDHVLGEGRVAWADTVLHVADLSTGWETTPTGARDIPLAIRGERIVVGEAKDQWRGVTGPLRLLEGSKVVARAPRPANERGPVGLTDEGVVIDVKDHAEIHGPEGRVRALRWTSSTLANAAVAGGTRVVGVGSMLEISARGRTQSLVERDIVRAVAVAHDGATVWVAVTKSIRAVPVGKGKAKTLTGGHTYDVVGLGACPDGTLVSGSRDQLVLVWNPDGTVRHRLPEHRAPILGVAVDPAGRVAASIGEDGTLRTWDLATGLSLGVTEVGDRGGDLAFAADGVHLAWFEGASLVVGREGVVVRRVSLPAAGRALASDPARPGFAVATDDGAVTYVTLGGEPRTLASGHVPVPRVLAFGDGVLLVGSCAGNVAGAFTELSLAWGA